MPNSTDRKMAITSGNPVIVPLCSVLILFHHPVLVCHAASTITRGQVIRDGETLVSAHQMFALGFFSPGNSTYRYLGIWYHNVSAKDVVWVANRANPVSGKDGVLKIRNDGNLMVLDGSGSSVWSTNVSTGIAENSTATLLDTGNLILSSSKNVDDPSEAYWRSFEDPTDTFLPGMRVEMAANSGEERIFTSWRSPNDPSLGSYSMGIDTHGLPQVVIWEHSKRWWRSGHWDGLIFTGIPSMRPLLWYGFKLSTDDNGSRKTHFAYTVPNRSDIVRFSLQWDGKEQQLRWDEGAGNWRIMQSFPTDECNVYNKCGNFGSCNVMDATKCSCLDGFEPRYIDEWNKGNWSGGCVRRTQLQCERKRSTDEDTFLEVKGVKLPDLADLVMLDRKGCEEECLKNCSCTAYASVSGINCMQWSGDLVDIQQFSVGGNTLYIRVADSEFSSKRIVSDFVIITIAVAGTIFVIACTWLVWKLKEKLKVSSNTSQTNSLRQIFDSSGSKDFSNQFSGPGDLIGEGRQRNGPELPLFNFDCVSIATNYFSHENKLGQGGFGPVYKGKLPGGEQIAVKRLSKWSGQGLEEFKNEIILIAKLQHRNLVRLLGCCIQGEEKMLIYEYLPNKSLDCFIFDPAKQAQLDWRKRYTIIEGIARGLLYLHRDSRLRIIHRDLKASNILLDEEMNPKISDFGMAKIFGGNQNEANTSRVVGTYGYMSPEYAMEGLFSVKSDVYSFGILLLEILSGRRNSSFRSQDISSLVGYAWHLWNEGRIMDFVDQSLGGSCSQSEVRRCMHVGLLCVQDSAANRPTMSSVLLMLESEAATLPLPKQPTFSSMMRSIDMDLCPEGHDFISSNNVTVTVIVGR
ncbi:G-type lectin S-receptor-like serine/threonine-protein kinase B120 [Malania oleifera]|uniref:G-type lectin S-receptor-like serine/threonine-protein kinase B120 n=1 Tax=Malania oleifera TaxID=397392 RepID=UPI0025ADF6BB|nr:G-type lectin S-receptor-like serine/threonine-protein kinase B120 [Malania oleifera]